MRYADTHAPRLLSQHLPLRTTCVDSLMAIIATSHQVPAAEVRALAAQRDWLVDFLAVFLPLLLLYFAVARHFVRRVHRSFEPDERRPRLVAMMLASLVVSGLAVPAASMWAWIVEMLRLQNSHISFRSSRIPTSLHPELVFATALLAFWLVAGRARFRRLPQPDRRPPLPPTETG